MMIEDIANFNIIEWIALIGAFGFTIAFAVFLITSRNDFPVFSYPEESKTDEDTKESIHEMERAALFEIAARLIVSHQQGSTQMIRNKLNIGYATASRLINQLEEAGVIAPPDRKKIRRVLVRDENSLNLLLEKKKSSKSSTEVQ